MNEFSEKTIAGLANRGYTIVRVGFLPPLYNNDTCLRVGQKGFELVACNAPGSILATFIEVLTLAGTN